MQDAEQWLQRDLIPESDELRRALRDMIADSSNDATGLVLDLLTGTTSGPELQGDRWQQWQRQRRLVNDWLAELAWPELEPVNCCQKTWGDGPYGREKQFYGADNSNRNALTTAATARMLEAVMTGAAHPPPARRRSPRAVLPPGAPSCTAASGSTARSTARTAPGGRSSSVARRGTMRLAMPMPVA